MLLSLSVMLSIWIITYLLKKFFLKSCGVIVAIFLAILFASAGGFAQGAIASLMNDAAGISLDPMIYVRGAFLTFCISLYIVYSTLRSGSGGVAEEK